eukprot:700561-Amphidinium_carterae.4
MCLSIAFASTASVAMSLTFSVPLTFLESISPSPTLDWSQSSGVCKCLVLATPLRRETAKAAVCQSVPTITQGLFEMSKAAAPNPVGAPLTMAKNPLLRCSASAWLALTMRPSIARCAPKKTKQLDLDFRVSEQPAKLLSV